jgi:hypothetical protein
VDNAVFHIYLCIITTAACPDSQNIITDSHSKDSSPHHHPLVSHSISRKQKSFGVLSLHLNMETKMVKKVFERCLILFYFFVFILCSTYHVSLIPLQGIPLN